MNSLPKTVTRPRRDCELNPGPSAPESSALTSRLPSHPNKNYMLSEHACSLPFETHNACFRQGCILEQFRGL